MSGELTQPRRPRAFFVLVLAVVAAQVLALAGAQTARADDAVHSGTPGLVFEAGAVPGTATVTSYAGSETDVVIPAEVTLGSETLAVTTIGASAFDAYSTSSPTLTSVVIPDSVVAIGESAFMSNAFSSLVLPDSVETVGDFAFLGTPLQELVLGEGLRSLGESAFEHYDYVRDELLPLAVTFTGPAPTIVAGSWTTVSGSFSDVDRVTISYPAAYDASHVDGGYTRPTWQGYETASHVDVDFVLGYEATITIPSARIPEGSELTLPADPTRDGYEFTGWFADAALTSAFVADEPVTSDTTLYAGWIDPDPTVHAIVDGIFYYVDPTQPDAFAFAGGVWDGPVRDLVIRSEVEIEGQTYVVGGVGRFAFQDAGLRSVRMPDTITVIEEGAFQTSSFSRANRFSDLVVPDSVVTIGEGAFWGTRLESLTLGAGVRDIAAQAFVDSELPELHIPDGVRSIGGYAFFGGAFTSLTIPASVTSIGENAFREGALETVQLPARLQHLGWGAFRDNALRSVTIPDTLATIEVETFAGNPLTEIRLGASVTSIAASAFEPEPEPRRRSLSTPAHTAVTARAASVTDGVSLTVTFTGPPPASIVAAGPTGSFGSAAGVLVLYPLSFDAATYPGGFTRPGWNGYASAATATISFDLNGHGTPVAPITGIVGEPLGALPTLQAAGWSFRGWFADRTAITPVDADTLVTGDLTLFAGWLLVPASDTGSEPQPAGLAVAGGRVDLAPLIAGLLLVGAGAALVVARRLTRVRTAVRDDAAPPSDRA